MELQLGLALPTPNKTKGFDLNNRGFDLLKEMRGWNYNGGRFGDKDCVKNKRSFEQAFANFTEECKATSLLLWSGQPNEEEDHKDQKKRTSSTIDENDAEEDQVVGWPPIKSWRKKMFHQNQAGRIENNRATEKENGGRSIYVKVKMEGVAIARKIDMRLYHSYQSLTNSLITMFAKRQKSDEDDYRRYTLTYQDKEGDWLIAGDIPWQTFIRSVQRLEIVRNSGVKVGVHDKRKTTPKKQGKNGIRNDLSKRLKTSFYNKRCHECYNPCFLVLDKMATNLTFKRLRCLRWTHKQIWDLGLDPLFNLDGLCRKWYKGAVVMLTSKKLKQAIKYKYQLFPRRIFIIHLFLRSCVHVFHCYSVMGFLSFSFLILGLLQLVSAQQTTDPNEVAALSKILDYWNLGSKINLTIDPCSQNAPWTSEDSNPRVACDCYSSPCHVTHLKIYALDIKGEIPGELFELKELMDLNLGQNVLNGSIPGEIGQLSKMQYLSLGINNLTGAVPSELGNLTKLLSLSFSSNNFFGPLPKELGSLTSLQQLYIDSSGVSGPIPQEFANLKSLQILWASDNLLTGKLPEYFGTFTEFRDMRLEGTSLEGPIPSSFAALTNLEDLRIGDLNGEDSSLDFLDNQTSLSTLSLRDCLLSGQIPERLGKFTKLKYMDLSFNKLTGQIPTSFQGFSSLQFLYLGNNNLSGELPEDIITLELIALDVSFNPLSGNLPRQFAKVKSMNVVGTSINANDLQDSKVSGMLECLQGKTKCKNKVPSTSFSIKCGGTAQKSASGIEFDDDSEILGAASFFTNTDNQWAVSSAGIFISNPNGNRYTAKTDSQITGTLESELYITARISPSSLRYYGLGLKNGKYIVELHFAEIEMDDTVSWKGLGRRLFDVYIQGDRVLQDLNIQKEAGGSKKALIRKFEANVTNTIMEIHFLWAGKGTCCIPYQSTYGPLVSAIHASQVSEGAAVTSTRKRMGQIVGIVIGAAAGLVIMSSIFYLWWKKDPQDHMRIFRDSPRKPLT
ncbi:probable LRR receptor-like serine/threonine-protein kinase At1g56130 [Durio zibethinus]|uniref:Auxin-responsive protein n=1 Tax=Durio zibethinus TaxID=66656 RepID=A0A6P5XLR8_DURZI|nr:probable LRR receptor-like serine/threonine-protein kinase At1g56130 [Durio zibethinus]